MWNCFVDAMCYHVPHVNFTRMSKSLVRSVLIPVKNVIAVIPDSVAIN